MIMRKRIKQWIIRNNVILIVLIPIIVSTIAALGKVVIWLLDPNKQKEPLITGFKKFIVCPYFIDGMQILLIFCTFAVLIRIHGWILVNENEKEWLKVYLRKWSTKIDKSKEAIETTTRIVSFICNLFYCMWLVIWVLFLMYYSTNLIFEILFENAKACETLDYVQTWNFIRNILNFSSSAAMYCMYIILNNASIQRRMRPEINDHSFERSIILLVILFFIVIIFSVYGTLLCEDLYGIYQFIVSLCLAGFSTLSFILLLGRLNSNHLMIPNSMLYGLYLYAMIQLFAPFMDIWVNMDGNEGIIELYVKPGEIVDDYLYPIFQYLTFIGKMILTITIIWIAKEYRLMYFVLYKSLSLEQTPIRMRFFKQFMSSSEHNT